MIQTNLLFLDNTDPKGAKKLYQNRRKKISKSFRKAYFIDGLEHDANGTHVWAHCVSPIFQEPLLLYLTGINQIQTALFVDPINKIECLFLPNYNAKNAFWDGQKLWHNSDTGSKDSAETTGIKTIYDWNERYQFLKEHVADYNVKELGLYWHQSSKTNKVIKDSLYTSKNRIKNLLPKTAIENISTIQWQQRSIDSIPNDSLMKKAQKKTAIAFKNTVNHLGLFKTEYELAGRLQGECLKQSPYGLSFNPIVASEKNATVLHYISNHQAIKKNSLILLDFGIRWHSVQTDISRTIPANGIFNPLQALLYTIVLDTQKYVEKHVKAGIRLIDLNKLCWDYLNKELDSQIKEKGGSYELDYDEKPHFVGHRIGYQVHDGDPFGDYRHEKLVDGTIISNEPGLYGQFKLKIDNKLYNETIGIRIEDNLKVTKSGCINYSKSIPKEISELENLINDT